MSCADLDKGVPIGGTLKAVEELGTKLGIDLLESVERLKLWKVCEGLWDIDHDM